MYILKQIKDKCTRMLRPATVMMALAFVCAFIFCAFMLPALPPHDEVITGYQAVRLHVLANSDSEIDQSVKLEVRDAVNTLLSAPLQRADNRDEALETLKTMQPEIQKAADAALKECGMPYTAAVSIERDMFPERVYGDTVYPAGSYEAVRVLLGDAGGQNWWCVVFPPLCYTDIRQAEITDEEELEAYLESGDVQVKSIFQEWWEELFGNAADSTAN